jgi:hypothetical protein
MDDMLEGGGRGLRGHAAAVMRGQFSTGALKAVGTASLALAAMQAYTYGDMTLFRGTLAIVLLTNLFNLFDLRPGRAWKGFIVCLVAFFALGRTTPLESIGIFAAPLLVLGAYDLRERCMLGDTGANLMGALVGMWVVLGFGPAGEWAAIGLAAALTIFGEFRSFSATIDRFPPLRALDSLGRKSHA